MNMFIVRVKIINIYGKRSKMMRIRVDEKYKNQHDYEMFYNLIVDGFQRQSFP